MLKSWALRCGAHPVRNGKRLISAVEEFDGHEDHLPVTEVFKVMNLVLPGAISLVAGLAGRVAVFDRRAVMDVLAPAATRHRGPEIIEHMAVETDPLARRKPDDPAPHAVILRNQGRAPQP